MRRGRGAGQRKPPLSWFRPETPSPRGVLPRTHMGDGITTLFLNIPSFPNFQKCYIDYVLLLNQIFKTQWTSFLNGKVDRLLEIFAMKVLGFILRPLIAVSALWVHGADAFVAKSMEETRLSDDCINGHKAEGVPLTDEEATGPKMSKMLEEPYPHAISF